MGKKEKHRRDNQRLVILFGSSKFTRKFSPWGFENKTILIPSFSELVPIILFFRKTGNSLLRGRFPQIKFSSGPFLTDTTNAIVCATYSGQDNNNLNFFLRRSILRKKFDFFEEMAKVLIAALCFSLLAFHRQQKSCLIVSTV